jgi:hypothetical protein
MNDLELTANLLGCYIVSNNKGMYALFDNETGKQCSEFNTLEFWQNINEAKVMLDYLKTAN